MIFNEAQVKHFANFYFFFFHPLSLTLARKKKISFHWALEIFPVQLKLRMITSKVKIITHLGIF